MNPRKMLLLPTLEIMQITLAQRKGANSIDGRGKPTSRPLTTSTIAANKQVVSSNATLFLFNDKVRFQASSRIQTTNMHVRAVSNGPCLSGVHPWNMFNFIGYPDHRGHTLF